MQEFRGPNSLWNVVGTFISSSSLFTRMLVILRWGFWQNPTTIIVWLICLVLFKFPNRNIPSVALPEASELEALWVVGEKFLCDPISLVMQASRAKTQRHFVDQVLGQSAWIYFWIFLDQSVCTIVGQSACSTFLKLMITTNMLSTLPE